MLITSTYSWKYEKKNFVICFNDSKCTKLGREIVFELHKKQIFHSRSTFPAYGLTTAYHNLDITEYLCMKSTFSDLWAQKFKGFSEEARKC